MSKIVTSEDKNPDSFVMKLSSGRVLSFSMPSRSKRIALSLILGQAAMENEMVFTEILLFCGITEIDGLPLLMPKNQSQLDNLLDNTLSDEEFKEFAIEWSSRQPKPVDRLEAIKN